jgi:hypothetical protein
LFDRRADAVHNRMRELFVEVGEHAAAQANGAAWS